MEELEDPRRTKGGHILHKLEDIIIIGLRTLLCNGEDFTDMEAFGELREEWRRTFLELPHGIPSSDTFRRVFERIKPEALAECLTLSRRLYRCGGQRASLYARRQNDAQRQPDNTRFGVRAQEMGREQVALE